MSDQPLESEIIQEVDPQLELQNALVEMKDKWLRSEAELANVRARAKKDANDARLYAIQKFAKDVIESAENLSRGINSLPNIEDEGIAKLREGLESIERNLLTTLERNGIKRVDPTGSTFNPDHHQAMAEEESDHDPGTIIQAYSHTWTLNGRLLKPAMVIVSKSSDNNQ